MVKAVYKNDEKEFKKFLRYTVFVQNKKMATPIAFGSVAAAAFLALLVLAFATGAVNMLFLAGGVLCAFLAALSFFMNFAGVSASVKKTLKNAPDFANITNTYIFDGADNFDVETQIGKKTETRVFDYANLHRAVETKRFFYLYVNAKIAFMIEKSGITEGTAEDLRSILCTALDDKRYKCKKQRRFS